MCWWGDGPLEPKPPWRSWGAAALAALAAGGAGALLLLLLAALVVRPVCAQDDTYEYLRRPAAGGAAGYSTAPLEAGDVDDVPVDGATAVPVSSNWAADLLSAADPFGQYMLDADPLTIDGGTP